MTFIDDSLSRDVKRLRLGCSNKANNELFAKNEGLSTVIISLSVAEIESAVDVAGSIMVSE